MNVGRSKSKFPFSLFNKKPVWELLYEFLHNIGGAIGAVVLNDKDMEKHRKIKDITNDFLDILFLVICRDDYQIFCHNTLIVR